MLMTMEHASNEALEIFPNPERLDKVEESMENLESVVRERNEAYFMLETGQSGEVPSQIVNTILGMSYFTVYQPFTSQIKFKKKINLGIKYFHRFGQHVIPKYLNRRWFQKYLFGLQDPRVDKFLLFYNEKFSNLQRYVKR